MSEWISCEERMPTPEEEVLVMWGDDMRVSLLLWDEEDFESGGGSYLYWADPDEGDEFFPMEEVTHWMELPASPAE